MTNIEWVRGQIEKGLTQDQIHNLYSTFSREQGSIASFSSFKRRVREGFEERAIDELEDVVISNEGLTDLLVKTSAKTQRLQDTKNYQVKIKREHERLFNQLDGQYSTMVSLLEQVDLSKFKFPPIKKDRTKKYGVLQLSDTHINELILPKETHGMNAYDFDIFSKRLRKFVLASIEEFKNNDVTDVYVAMTGDLVNSSRRLSEKLAQITSLTKASLLGVFLFEQAFLELRKAGLKLHITSIVGNESRLTDFMDSSDILASENWDFLIFNQLRHLLKKVNGIEFIVPENLITSLVKMPNGFNFLIDHGHNIKGDLNKSVAKMIQPYIYQGETINMILTGHFHNALIGDFACRSSSMCGANSYSTSDLMFISRASQNIYIISSDLSFKGIKIDLQNTDNVIGYDLITELESYEAKSIKPNMRIISEVLA